MTVEQKLKDLICERYGSVFEFSKKIGIPNSTISSILTRGVQKASISNIIKICEELNISADEVANNKIVFNTKTLNNIDIEQQIKNIKNSILESNSTLDNIALSDVETDIIFDAFNFAVNCIRKIRRDNIC